MRLGCGPAALRFLFGLAMPVTEATFPEILARYSIQLDPEQIERLQRYCELLWEWNRKLNLTRHLDYETFVVRDLVDTQHLAAHVPAGLRVLDIGSGGGVPGVLLAILRPDLQVTLSESMGKKANALEDILRRLPLPLPVEAARAETVLEQARFDVLVARAVGPLWKLLRWLAPHWNAFDQLLLIKGPRWVEERFEARHRGQLRRLDLRRLAEYPTPGHAGQNVILSLTRKSEMPDGD